MEEVKLTKEQEILFEVYDKGVQNEDCDLDAYVEKMKQALSIAIVSHRRELLDFKDWWNNLPDESDDKLYITDETIDRYLKSNCG